MAFAKKGAKTGAAARFMKKDMAQDMAMMKAPKSGLMKKVPAAKVAMPKIAKKK